jgi:hypothetical protein
MPSKYESLIKYCEGKGICPEPYYWQSLWEIIEKRKILHCEWEPPRPLILGAWHMAPLLFKAVAFSEQIRWATEHEILDEVDSYLRSLGDHCWFKN